MNTIATRTLLGVGIVALLSACNNDNNDNFQSSSPIPNNVVDVASKTANLSTLVSAVQYASNNNDLVNTLQRQPNLTVFAPSNAAFEALAAELQVTDENNDGSRNALDLLTNKYRDTVRSVLQYHILNQELSSADLRNRLNKAITNPNGGLLFVKQTQTNALQIQDGRNRTSNIETPDVDVGNGTVHIIDKVLLPADKTIVATAQATPALSNLVSAIQFASDSQNILQVLGTASSSPTLTVFAPNNTAFDNLAKALACDNNATFASYIAANATNTAVKDTVRDVLRYHVLADQARLSGDFTSGQVLNTLLPSKTSTVNNAVTGITDFTNSTSNFDLNNINILTNNGTVHVIDRVLLPITPPTCATVN